MNLASSSRLSAAAALPTDRPICNARVPQAIGQSFDWLVPAEAEVLGARVADRPAAFPLAELEQRASASVVDRDVFSRRLGRQELMGDILDSSVGALWTRDMLEAARDGARSEYVRIVVAVEASRQL